MSKILIIGASKGIGKATVKEALNQGHQVTAFARHTEELNIKNDNLRLFNGDVLDLSSVMKVMDNQEVVICTLGLPTLQAIGPPFAKSSYVLSTGTSNILQAMEAKNVKRILCVTAIGSGDSIKKCSLPTRLALRHCLKWLFSEKDQQEKLIKKSKLDWTIIRPTTLTNGNRKEPQIFDQIHVGLLTQVSRADVAHVMLEAIGNPNAKSKALIVSYPPKLGDSLRWLTGYFGR